MANSTIKTGLSSPTSTFDGKGISSSSKIGSSSDIHSWDKAVRSASLTSTGSSGLGLALRPSASKDFLTASDSDFQWKPPVRWYHGFSLIGAFEAFMKCIERLTSLPIAPAPAIYFDEDEKYDSKGERIKKDTDAGELPGHRDAAAAASEPPFPGLENIDIELLVNYEKESYPLIEAILKYRKDALDVKNDYHIMKIDQGKFPLWNEPILDRLRTTFQIFDLSGDGLVDFNELTTILKEFGDTSPEQARRKYFDEVDDHSGSIGFMQFLSLVYKLTVHTPPEHGAEILAQVFHDIDRNIARLQSLDMVQQLQAGIF